MNRLLNRTILITAAGQGMGRSAALACAREGAQVIATDINAAPDPLKARQDFISRQPMDRLATADEIAETFAYLLSDESSFVTGQAIVADGGMSL
jgi:NAD(P)-dependent dehydrogenase (short-subunit alcohol dehydrogenase family)